MLPSGDLWSHNVHHLPHYFIVWGAGFLMAVHLLLQHVYALGSALPPISTTCTLLQHHRALSIFTLKAVRKIPPHGASHKPCCPILKNGATGPDTFSCYLVTDSLLPSLPLGPTPRGHEHQATTCVGHWLLHSLSLRPLFLLGILLTMPVVLLFTLFAEPRVWKMKETSNELGSWKKNSRTVGTCVFSPRWCGSQCSRYAIFLSWFTQQTQP